ncbi:hypothetical protein MLD38_005956 [Melastoma candidum]|uniref:Uncharacterized protein n=1 Tax=Melastoma candidum TaxID=119954 RepID=A0ACB9RKY7_9MYRT|nr:hypothetical protein MLD38_005956 [Melastoma candidum]
MTLFVVAVVLFHSAIVTLSAPSESDILVAFKKSIVDPKNALSSWSGTKKPCVPGSGKAKWVGVLCLGGAVWGLQLENMGLSGHIDVDSLTGLKGLRTLSVRNNNFDGPLPDLGKLGALKSVYLSNNKFSGDIPDDAFSGMLSLKKLHLGGNSFTGRIPTSLTKLPKLLEVGLERNQLSGCPKLILWKQSTVWSPAKSMRLFHCWILTPQCHYPRGHNLCGVRDPGSRSLSSTTEAETKLGGRPAFAIQPPEKGELPGSNNGKQQGGSPDSSGHGKKAESTKLSFVRDDREKFELHDLLKSSAEILGSGCFGSSYKAALVGGPAMVVKRFRQMNNVGREEFQEHMRRLGRLSHPNLLSLVAFYYRKEEKLLVYDFVKRGSLAVQLHSNHARGQPALDWPTRLKIVKGVARGLSYLYNELPSLITPHGHLKSSNVLLNESFEALLTDYTLVPVINSENAQDLMVAYKSPEFLQNKRITKKTDVWSLGILILEIMTGKLPANFLQQGKEMSVPAGSENQMVKLLKVGLRCCDADADKRLDMKEAMEQIEEVREKDGNDDLLS